MLEQAQLKKGFPVVVDGMPVLTHGEESSGGLVNYYLVEVKHPQRDVPPYQAECEDIIDALELTFDEANIFKEIWRTARQRQGVGKKGNTPIRAAEKMVHYSNRILRKAKL